MTVYVLKYSLSILEPSVVFLPIVDISVFVVAVMIVRVILRTVRASIQYVHIAK